MMFEEQFVLQNVHFTINIIASFIFFCMGWLYFDAWLFKKTLRVGLKILGYAFLCLSFLVHATVIEQTILKSPFLGPDVLYFTGLIIELAGLGLITTSLFFEGLQKVVHYQGIKTNPAHTFFIFPATASFIAFPLFLAPFLAASAGLLYLRRATVGLENHLKPVSLAFFLLAFSHILSLARVFQSSSNTGIYNLFSSFGPFWIAEHIFLCLAVFIFGRWVFQYLFKRAQTQIFIVSEIFILVIFLFTTMILTSFLLKNMRDEYLFHLQTDANVLSYAVDNKKAETLSDAQMVSQNSDIVKAVEDGDKHTLRQITESILLSKKEDFLTVVSSDAKVLMRADDPGNTSDSLSDDTLVQRALMGKAVSTVTVRDGVLAPVVSIRSAVPIRAKESILGTVIAGTNVDNAFVDGVKKATGLESAVYGGSVRSATTLIAPDGKSRWVGIKEEDPFIKKAVLEEGKIFTGSTDILNVSYLAAFAPLKDVDNNPVGMLFVGKEQTGVLQAAAYSIQLTFIISVCILILSVVPARLFSNYLTGQLR